MKKQILLPVAARREMVVTFKSSRCELGRALTSAVNSNRAQMLRAAALKRGGPIYTAINAPKRFVLHTALGDEMLVAAYGISYRPHAPKCGFLPVSAKRKPLNPVEIQRFA